MGASGVSAKGDEIAECGKTAECAEARVRVRMGETVELLARGWPQDYPDGAVEWQLF